jgi:pimeloyl-ACP methyl ester carboxylesterase
MVCFTTLTNYLSLSSEENVFYREAGPTTSPTVLLLHGFPSSSHQYRHLIAILAPHYHVIAPDLPAFGFTSVPDNYTYTFDNIAQTIDTFLAEIPDPPRTYSIYMFDYGAPTGFRIALKHPERIQAIVSQNGNAYDEGLGSFGTVSRPSGPLIIPLRPAMLYFHCSNSPAQECNTFKAQPTRRPSPRNPTPWIKLSSIGLVTKKSK